MPTTKKVGEASTDYYVIVATPKEKSFSDGATVRVIQDCSLQEALHILRSVTGMESGADVADLKLDEADSIMLIKGMVVPMTTDMSAVDVDGTQYKLKEDSVKFVTDFINIKE